MLQILLGDASYNVSLSYMLRMASRAIENTFCEQLEQMRVSNKKSLLLSKEDYFNLIEELKVAESCGDKTKTWRQYYILNRYEVLQCGDVEKLIKKRRNEENGEERTLYFAHIDEMHDIVKRAHTSTGHGGRQKMQKALSAKYANITREVILCYAYLFYLFNNLMIQKSVFNLKIPKVYVKSHICCRS